MGIFSKIDECYKPNVHHQPFSGLTTFDFQLYVYLVRTIKNIFPLRPIFICKQIYPPLFGAYTPLMGWYLLEVHSLKQELGGYMPHPSNISYL